MNLVFANCSEEDVIYPLTVNEIVEAQLSDPSIQKLASDKKYTILLVENTQVLCKGTAMVLPTALHHRAISWYTTTTYNSLEQLVSRRHSVLQCTGQV